MIIAPPSDKITDLFNHKAQFNLLEIYILISSQTDLSNKLEIYMLVRFGFFYGL